MRALQHRVRPSQRIILLAHGLVADGLCAEGAKERSNALLHQCGGRGLGCGAVARRTEVRNVGQKLQVPQRVVADHVGDQVRIDPSSLARIDSKASAASGSTGLVGPAIARPKCAGLAEHGRWMVAECRA